MAIECIRADLAAPVTGFAVTRAGGVSAPPFDALNLGMNTADDPERVAENRARLTAELPAAPRWLRQVHGTRVVHSSEWSPDLEADGLWTDRPNEVLAVLTADCLPILLADRDGRCVAAVHAGWRGLAAGIIDSALAALPVAPERVHAWIGPAIRAGAYEVDAPVRRAFPGHDHAFVRSRPGHWRADLAAIARAEMRAAGVRRVRDCGLCSHDDSRFFSHRRAAGGGRGATLIWRDSLAGIGS